MNGLFKNRAAAAIFSLMVIAATLLGVGVLAGPSVSAQSPAELACEGTGAAYDKTTKTCGVSKGSTALFGDGGLVEKVIDTLLFITGGIAVVMVIVGGLRYVASAGDQNAVTAAKNTILYAIIGLVISIMAFAIVQFIVGALS